LFSREPEKKDPKIAYRHLIKAVTMGVSFFEEMNSYFKDNYDLISPDFIKTRKPGVDPAAEVKQEILNLHEAYVNELKTNFMAALGRDRMYKRPCGSVTD
jgi:hypothetical protein